MFRSAGASGSALLCRVPRGVALVVIASCVALGARAEGVTTPADSHTVAQGAMRGEPHGTLTLGQAHEFAASSSLSLLIQGERLAAARFAATDASRRPNPTLETSVENFGGGLGSDRAEATLQLGQVLELGGKRAARIRAAKAGTAAALSGYQLARLSLREAVDEAFLSTWAAQERVHRLSAAEAAATQAIAAAEERLRIGAGPPSERSRAQAELYARRGDRQRAEAELRSARRRLAATWTATEAQFDSVVLDTPSSIPSLPTDQTLERLTRHPDLRRAQAELEAQRARVAAARAARVPDLELRGGLRRLQEIPATGLVAGASLPLPLWGTPRGALGAAEAEQRATAIELKATELRLRTEAAEAEGQVASAWQTYQLERTLASPAARGALRFIAEGYRAGRYGYVDYFEARRTVMESEMRLLDATRELWDARLRLERLLGAPDSLEVKP